MTTSGTTPAGLLAALAGPALLRTSLRLDAVVTGLNGAAYVAGAAVLDGLLGLDAGLLRGAGVFLLVYGAGVGLLGRRPRIPRAGVRGVVAVNAVWAAGGLVAAALGWGTPGAVGTVWIVAQALVVGGFAVLQTVGLRRRPHVPVADR